MPIDINYFYFYKILQYYTPVLCTYKKNIEILKYKSFIKICLEYNIIIFGLKTY